MSSSQRAGCQTIRVAAAFSGGGGVEGVGGSGRGGGASPPPMAFYGLCQDGERQTALGAAKSVNMMDCGEPRKGPCLPWQSTGARYVR